MADRIERGRNIQTDDDGASSIVSGGEDVVEQPQKRRFRGITSALSGLERAKVDRAQQMWSQLSQRQSLENFGD